MILVRAVHEPWNTHRRLSKISSSTLRNRQPHPVHTDDDIDKDGGNNAASQLLQELPYLSEEAPPHSERFPGSPLPTRPAKPDPSIPDPQTIILAFLTSASDKP